MKIIINIVILTILKLTYSNACISSSVECSTACTDQGYKIDSGNCRDPTEAECLTASAAECTGTKTRCLAYGYTAITSSGDCHKPTDDECANNSVGNSDLCSSSSYVCQVRGFQKSSTTNDCTQPTDCLTTSGSCIYPLTACLYLGYVPDSSGNCQSPDLSYCSTSSNSYACYKSNGFCITNGWTQDSTTYSCVAPTQSTCENTSGKCASNADACSYIYGYIQDTNTSLCIQPTANDCYNTSYTYNCRTILSFCRVQGWLKNSSNNTCLPDSDCLNGTKCQSAYTSCLYQGYIKSTSSDACVQPISPDCEAQTNLYACALSTSTCQAYGWKKHTTNYYCVAPTSAECVGQSKCSSEENACPYLYGLINISNACTAPNTYQCANSAGKYGCRLSTHYCSQLNFENSSNTCVLPTNCLAGTGMCATAYTSCTYQGYVKNSTDNNCILPTSYHCSDQTNLYACALPTNACITYGWKKDTTNYYCIAPTSVECLGQPKCGAEEYACPFLYGLVNNSNACAAPDTFTCANTAGKYGCRLSTHYCQQLNFQKDSSTDACVLPTNCLAGTGMCAAAYTSCTYQGYVKNSSNNDCVQPTQLQCSDITNIYACALTTNTCITYGWKKDATNSYCASPAKSECVGLANCSSDETACVYLYGYVNTSNVCTEPTTIDCADTTKKYGCRDPTSFCRLLYFAKNASNDTCALPTTCISDGTACKSPYTACQYQGYVKNSSNNSCKVPIASDCSTSSNIYACALVSNQCVQYGWEKVSATDYSCQSITLSNCLNTGQNYCQYQESSCMVVHGYVKSSSSNDCVVPTPFDCYDVNNKYACKNTTSFCRAQGWPKNALATNYSCVTPASCLNQSACSSGLTACPYFGYVESSTNPGVCIQPSDSDCSNTSNAYACAQTANQCFVIGYIKTTVANSYYCTAPTTVACQSNNNCRSGYSACQYTYGYVNDYTANQCIQPTDKDCASNTNPFVCRLSSFTCRTKNWLQNGSNFTCVAPSNCLTGTQCQAGYTSCQYIGYMKSTSGNNCVLPTDADCMNTSNIYLCRADITFCTAYGWQLQTAVANSYYCVAPPDCLGNNKCGGSLTACKYIGYLPDTNSNCVTPSDYDCVDTTNNPFLCRSDISFCTSKGFIKAAGNNNCTNPTSCPGANDCATGKTACQFALGLVKSSSNNTCVAPTLTTCFDPSNIYVCKAGNTICIALGFVKKATDNTCDLPTNCTINNQCASGLQVCMYYYGYIKDTATNQCVIPNKIDCINSANLYVCRTGNNFCTNLGYVLNAATTGQCQVPTNCTSGLKCGPDDASQACLYNGYISTSSTNYLCKIPQYSDCLDITNTQLCRTGIYQNNCLTIGFVKSASADYCVFPTNCTTGTQCGSTKLVCFKLGYVKSTSSNACVAPTDYDCNSTVTNPYACSTDSLSTLCRGFGWVKDAINEHCVPPSDCIFGSDCGSSRTVCQFAFGFAPEIGTNKCIFPSNSDCQISTNKYLCKSGNTYCTQIGYDKSASNDSCIIPTNCLTGNRCASGLTACMYGSGYVKSQIDSNCVSPTESDCENQIVNIFVCRLTTFPCVVKGWVKTTNANQSYCTHTQSTCTSLAGQCSSTITVCKYKYGYVKNAANNNCQVPTDVDCINPVNTIACLPNSFCVKLGWIAKSVSNFGCQSPDCNSGPNCQTSFTACIYQGFVKSLLDDTCSTPTDNDCAATSINGQGLCSPTSLFCTSRGWIKKATDNTCIPPTNCFTGFQCSPDLGACQYLGYVRSVNDYSCTTPSDSDCLDVSKSLCRPGLTVNLCVQKGYIRSTIKQTDMFCILPNCLDQVNPQCGGSLSACLFGGFLKNPNDNTCIVPTDDQCLDSQNTLLCRVGNIPCPGRGWAKDYTNPSLNACIFPDNCLTSNFMCGTGYTACTKIGYLKNSSNNNCVIPTDDQCVDPSQSYCTFSQSPCRQKGFVKSPNDNSCLYPTDCLGNNLCQSNKSACLGQGYIPTSISSNFCKIPSSYDCVDSKQYNCSPLLKTKFCEDMGFVKSSSSNQCEYPSDCLTGKQCLDTLIACKQKGYIKDIIKNDGTCSDTTISICLDSTNKDMCSQDSICISKFGLLPKSNSDLSCIAPSIAECQEQNICYGINSYCVTKYGFVQKATDNSCQYPNCTSITVNCPQICTYLGYETTSTGQCQIPTKCNAEGKLYCGANKVACISQGYKKSAKSDDCVCYSTIDLTGKCIGDNSITTSLQSSTNKLNSFLLLIIIIAMF